MIVLSSALTVGCRSARCCGVGRDVVLLGDLRSVAGLADQLLLGQEVVGEVRLQSPDPVEQPHLGWRVVAVVADHGADDRPVLLFDVGAVVGVTGTRLGEGDLPLLAPVQEVVVDELRSVVRVDAQQ